MAKKKKETKVMENKKRVFYFPKQNRTIEASNIQEAKEILFENKEI